MPSPANKLTELTLYVRSESPGEDKEANWLPAPNKGPLSVILRLYVPKPEALEGKRIVPPLNRSVIRIRLEEERLDVLTLRR